MEIIIAFIFGLSVAIFIWSYRWLIQMDKGKKQIFDSLRENSFGREEL